MSGKMNERKLRWTKDNMTFDIKKIRSDFPILGTSVNGKPLVYLDNAATTQKPQPVIDAIVDYYTRYNSNIHRGTHHLSNLATEAHETARKTVQMYINAQHEHEVIFTRGTTEAINLVAFSFGEAFVNPGDDVIVTEMDHHSNFVPWQMMCERRGVNFHVVPFDENGDLKLDVYQNLLSEKTRIVAFNHVSNSLGTVNPAFEMIQMAHNAGAAVLVDAAQSVQHIDHDVQALDADFYAFSGHKIYGPTGIGVLYGKEKWLNAMPPYQGGGEMIDLVTIEKTTYNTLPFKFEAGTPNIVGPIGLAAALNYLNSMDFNEIVAHEDNVLNYGREQLTQIDGLKFYGNAKHRTSILAFNIDGVHHYDLGTLLDTHGIAVRTGHHCTQPIMQALGVEGTVRASMALYNTREDIDALVLSIHKVLKLLGR
jgi:cysteine desulfurase / selenocysteine lyase